MRKFIPVIVLAIVCPLMVISILTMTSSLRNSKKEGGSESEVRVSLDSLVFDLRKQLQKELREKESLLQEVASLTSGRDTLQNKLADVEANLATLYQMYRTSQDNFAEACKTIAKLQTEKNSELAPPTPAIPRRDVPENFPF